MSDAVDRLRTRADNCRWVARDVALTPMEQATASADAELYESVLAEVARLRRIADAATDPRFRGWVLVHAREDREFEPTMRAILGYLVATADPAKVAALIAGGGRDDG